VYKSGAPASSAADFGSEAPQRASLGKSGGYALGPRSAPSSVASAADLPSRSAGGAITRLGSAPRAARRAAMARRACFPPRRHTASGEHSRGRARGRQTGPARLEATPERMVTRRTWIQLHDGSGDLASGRTHRPQTFRQLRSGAFQQAPNGSLSDTVSHVPGRLRPIRSGRWELVRPVEAHVAQPHDPYGAHARQAEQRRGGSAARPAHRP